MTTEKAMAHGPARLRRAGRFPLRQQKDRPRPRWSGVGAGFKQWDWRRYCTASGEVSASRDRRTLGPLARAQAESCDPGGR